MIQENLPFMFNSKLYPSELKATSKAFDVQVAKKYIKNFYFLKNLYRSFVFRVSKYTITARNKFQLSRRTCW